MNYSLERNTKVKIRAFVFSQINRIPATMKKKHGAAFESVQNETYTRLTA